METKSIWNKDVPPFDVVLIDKEPVEVENKRSGEKVILSPLAVAVYDSIKGAELLGSLGMFDIGMKWFQEFYSREYYILLD